MLSHSHTLMFSFSSLCSWRSALVCTPSPHFRWWGLPGSLQQQPFYLGGSGFSCAMRVYRYCIRQCCVSGSTWIRIILGTWIRIQINKKHDPYPHKIKIRIRIKVISRIRINVMRIRNTGIRQRVWFGSHCSNRWNYWGGGRWIV